MMHQEVHGQDARRRVFRIRSIERGLKLTPRSSLRGGILRKRRVKLAKCSDYLEELNAMLSYYSMKLRLEASSYSDLRGPS